MAGWNLAPIVASSFALAVSAWMIIVGRRLVAAARNSARFAEQAAKSAEVTSNLVASVHKTGSVNQPERAATHE
ncbi:hypothetical protein AB0I66_05495 [Streptomyces sp. NPDC050439]|uniref:hypothetical protein n=1 Tax=unclassified Streptomyces TaxID=2593676 RepID=UPI0034426097